MGDIKLNKKPKKLENLWLVLRKRLIDIFMVETRLSGGIQGVVEDFIRWFARFWKDSLTKEWIKTEIRTIGDNSNWRFELEFYGKRLTYSWVNIIGIISAQPRALWQCVRSVFCCNHIISATLAT